MIKQGLELKLGQKLSPFQIQTIKLLEIPIQELGQRVRKELEENPVLDEVTDESDVSLEEIKEDDYIPSYRLKVSNWGKDPRPQYNSFSFRESFTQSLMNQLGYRNLNERDYGIAAFIIGSLEADGYLRRDESSIADDLSFRAGIDASEQDVERCLKIIQELEPTGIGARNLQECLLLQLESAEKTPDTKNAIRILTSYFDDFSARRFEKIQTRLSISAEEMKAAIKRITKLNPSPGGQVDDAFVEQSQQIIPDFILRDEGDARLSFEMPRFSIPQLRINRRYEAMLRDAEGKSLKEQKETATFIKSKLDSAKWFVEALKQRQATLSKTMQAILDAQYDFFLSGDDKSLKPLILETIAEKTGYDISTISRVVGSKYIETPFGIFPLKYFFSEKLTAQDGTEVSTREVKSALRDIIENEEDKKNPLTDEQLVERLASKGYKVARRTVAKYRDQMGIPLARFRKDIYDPQ